MTHASARRIAAFASRMLLVTSLACYAPLHAQTAHNDRPVGVSTEATPADPAFIARAHETLLHARALIDKFFEQTSNVVCNEDVAQTLVGKNGKPMYREESVFEYQLLANNRSGSLRLIESREARKTAYRDAARTLLITNGFASMLLVLHQSYEASYVFTPVIEESADGRSLVKIHFQPVPGAASPAAIQLRNRNYPLPLTGDVWIDTESGFVVKLISSLESGMDDLGLHSIRSEIHYGVVQFHNPDESYWMPASAVIDVETPKQHWRNVHRFSAYRRFRATIQVETPVGNDLVGTSPLEVPLEIPLVTGAKP
jgi:hypothetical protein